MGCCKDMQVTRFVIRDFISVIYAHFPAMVEATTGHALLISREVSHTLPHHFDCLMLFPIRALYSGFVSRFTRLRYNHL
jgi:hypothetical protein